MSGDFHSLRKDNLIRPADPDKPVYSGWRDLPPESDWKRTPAIQSTNTERTRQQHKPIKPAVPKPTVCTQDGCNERVYKASLCKEHYDNVVRERNRAARAKRHEKEKILAMENKKREGERLCKECGDPAATYTSHLLCEKHHNAYQKAYSDKRKAESDRRKEATMKRNQELLAEVWGKKKAKYKKGAD